MKYQEFSGQCLVLLKFRFWKSLSRFTIQLCWFGFVLFLLAKDLVFICPLEFTMSINPYRLSSSGTKLGHIVLSHTRVFLSLNLHFFFWLTKAPILKAWKVLSLGFFVVFVFPYSRTNLFHNRITTYCAYFHALNYFKYCLHLLLEKKKFKSHFKLAVFLYWILKKHSLKYLLSDKLANLRFWELQKILLHVKWCYMHGHLLQLRQTRSLLPGLCCPGPGVSVQVKGCGCCFPICRFNQ